MPPGNPRVEDLRKRLERDPGSRLFAQLAEELRKDGALPEAISVCREGLKRHPGYPSARMTLGRCLMDSGNPRAAEEELRAVVAAAPDNILAARLLAECQEALGEFKSAAESYRAALRFAPTDKQIQARLEAAEARQGAVRAPAAALLHDREAPIPVTASDEPFELEGSGVLQIAEHRATGAATAPPPAPVPPASLEPQAAAGEVTFEFDSDAELTQRFEPVFRPLDVEEAEPSLRSDPSAETLRSAPAYVEPEPEPDEPPMARSEALFEPVPDAAEDDWRPTPNLPATLPGVPMAELASPTLAELYYGQGALDKAIETYRQVLQREPGNTKARERVAVLEREARVESAGTAPLDGVAARRATLQRTIARLEDFLAAVKRG